MASMTCWSVPAVGDALGRDDGESGGVGVTVGDGEGETGASAATRLSGTMTVVWLPPVTFMAARSLPGPASSVIWNGPGGPPTISSLCSAKVRPLPFGVATAVPRTCRVLPYTVTWYSLLLCLTTTPPPLPSVRPLSLIHISEPTRLGMISYAVFCLKKKNS